MNRDYNAILTNLENSFSYIKKKAYEKELNYYEIKKLFDEALENIKKCEEEMIINEVAKQHSDKFIPGTNVWQPREKRDGESEKDYMKYLSAYYEFYFPDQYKVFVENYS